MSSEGNGQLSYRLAVSGLIQQTITSLIAEADSLGSGAEVREAIASIFQRLRSNPLEFGELKGKLTTLNLLMHVATISPVVVHFGIHQQLKIVFIQKKYRI
jgi:hypothetical protein